MNCFIENNNPLHDISSWRKGRLGRLDNPLSNRCEPISQYFCEDLKANVLEANRSILLNFLCLGTFRQQNDSAKIEAK
jgi:hypothetical protein